MDVTTLESVKEENDLGVLIDDELKFRKHVSAAVLKANQTLGIVKRTFDTLNKELLPIVYKHQVRPHLEYLDQLHQFTAPDGLCIVGSSEIVCDSCGYLFHAQQSKFYDCLKCDNFTLYHLCVVCHKKGMHRKHCRNMELKPKHSSLQNVNTDAIPGRYCP